MTRTRLHLRDLVTWAMSIAIGVLIGIALVNGWLWVQGMID